MDDSENSNHQGRRLLIAAIVVAVVVLVGLFFLRRGKGEDGEKYRTEAVSRGNVSATVSATGTLSAVTTVQVGSQVSGIISQLYADFNSQVKQGQILAELDPTPFLQAVEQRRADVTKSQVEMANTQISYNRQKRLAEAGLAAQADVDAARAAYESTRAQLSLSQASLRQAETNLGYAKIYSPIDGQVVARQYDIGQTVAASFSAPTLFTIAKDLTKMQVQADVDQSDIGRVQVGQPVRFTVDAYPEQEFRGAIAQVRLNATVNQNVITYPVIIEVANPNLELRPSMTADVTMEVATVRNVLRVPNAALRFRPPEDEEDGEKGGDRRSRRGDAATAGSEGSAGSSASDGSGRRRGERGGAGGGSFSGGASSGGRRGGAGRAQTVYVLAEGGKKDDELRPVRISTGITDGRHTQVTAVRSGELKPGDLVVTGLETLKVEQGATPPGGLGGAGGGRGGRIPGMGRF